MKNECRIRNEPRQEAWCMKHNCYYKIIGYAPAQSRENADTTVTRTVQTSRSKAALHGAECTRNADTAATYSNSQKPLPFQVGAFCMRSARAGRGNSPAPLARYRFPADWIRCLPFLLGIVLTSRPSGPAGA